MYNRDALVSWDKQRGISIVPQAVSAVYPTATHTSTTVRLHSMQRLTVGATKIDHVFQMLQTHRDMMPLTIVLRFHWSLLKLSCPSTVQSLYIKTLMNNVKVKSSDISCPFILQHWQKQVPNKELFKTRCRTNPYISLPCSAITNWLPWQHPLQP